MTFGSPHFLWLLVLVGGLAITDAFKRALRDPSWPKVKRLWAGPAKIEPAHRSRGSRVRWFFWIGLLLSVLALARPRYGKIEERVFDQAREVIIALDLSRSMMTQDIRPSRLDRAKLLIQSLLEKLAGERVGLVLFSGTAFLQSPLSADYEILRDFLPNLNPDYLPEGGTNYRAMLQTALGSFSPGDGADHYLIVLSDGEALDDDWKPLMETLKERNVRVIGLGVGTASGGVIPDGAGGLVKDERGAAVLSRLEPATLQELARETGGVFSDASAWVDLAQLLQKTVDAGKKGDFKEKSQFRQIERFQWVLAPALLCFLISFWTEFPVRPKNRTIAAGINPVPASATAALFFLVLFLGMPASTRGAGNTPGSDAFSEPLVKLVGALSTKDQLNAKDYAELSEATAIFGERKQKSQEKIPESVIKNGMDAVAAGRHIDPKAADWDKLQNRLAELLKQSQQPPPPPKPDDKKQDQQNQQQDKKNSQQNQNGKSDKQDESQKDDQPKEDEKQEASDQKKSEEQQKKNADSAFGDMKKPEEKKPDAAAQPQPPPEPPSNETQKVGGAQPAPDQERLQNPELTLPLQKLDQVKNQDSPAKLFQMIEGDHKTPAKKGKDW